MQLNSPGGISPLRSRLHAAACLLFAAGLPAPARAQASGATRFDATTLLYGEEGRTRVVEPTARITRLFPDGQSLSVQLGLDVITGASPSGALPSGRTQTVTSASGRVSTVAADQIPLSNFNDTRASIDADWQKPLGSVTPAFGAHFSHEKDYQSLGANAKLSIDLMQRLATVTMGASIHQDGVTPTGGTPLGLSDGSTIVSTTSNPKQVTSALLGLSRVLTRRWMVGVNASHSFEQGYLTEPYKVISLVDPASGLTVGQLTDQRPDRRRRNDVLASTVYHLASDVLYVSYRHYWDDWQVRSNTIDLKYRHELDSGNFFEPHLRLYAQSAASFFTLGLANGAPLPQFATSDTRLGPLHSATIGATYGFRIPGQPGEWTVRAEYMGQYGDGGGSSRSSGSADGEGEREDETGAQQHTGRFPRVNIGSLLVGYSIQF